MVIFPAIDIKGGKVVRLLRGKFEHVTEYDEDPVAVARKWESEGALWLHVVDLDGAQKGSVQNFSVIAAIAQAVDVPVQMGGGARTEDEIKRLLDCGVARVVLGTRAVSDRVFLKQAIHTWGGRIAVSLDCNDGYVSEKGWTSSLPIKATELVKELARDGLATVIYTDINRDGMLKGPNIKALKDVLAVAKIPLIASGGVSSLDDLKKLKSLEPLGLMGVIVGKALYEGKIDLKEAVAIC